MSAPTIPDSVQGLRVHLVGAKGTGMAALAEILAASGALLSGSDTAEVFYTDAILRSIGLQPGEGFAAEELPWDAALVIHSAAYARDANPQLIEAARRGIPILNYPQALGALSRRADSSGIAGVHGKTTTTAMTGCLVAALGLPATLLAGSAVSNFGGRCTIIRGSRYFIAETCEYRRHFLSFRPRRIVLTSVEPDHQDYYPRYEDILAAFIEYGMSLPDRGELIYCADDPGAVEAAAAIGEKRPDIRLTSYGRAALGEYRLVSYTTDSGRAFFRLEGFDRRFELQLPGEHLALDACAALALSFSILRDERSSSAAPASGTAGVPQADSHPDAAELKTAAAALASFTGSKRRSEILGEAEGVLFMDDYGHHPTALRETLKGIRTFWPERRLVVDFMSHTYTRTASLFDDFVSSLDEAEVLILHKIYASAREAPMETVTGKKLFEAVISRRRGRGGYGPCLYFEEVLDGVETIEKLLRPGDLFLTMGAGDNWRLGAKLLERRAANNAADGRDGLA